MRWPAAVWMAVLTGCAQPMAAVTAGEVGCAPKEITIRDYQVHQGLTDSSETWLAVCRGHSYVCSRSNGNGLLGSHLTPKEEAQLPFQIACREQVELVASSSSSSSSSVASAPASAAPAPPGSASPKPFPPPKGAAGFDFGLTSPSAKAACERAGNAWSDGASASSCSGPAANIGFQGSVSLTFCQGALCAISVRVADPTDLRAATDELRAKLSEKYGAPRASGTIRPECSSPDGFARCFQSGAERLNYTWTWSSGELLQLSVGKSTTDGDAAIRLQYERDPKLSVDSGSL